MGIDLYIPFALRRIDTDGPTVAASPEPGANCHRDDKGYLNRGTPPPPLPTGRRYALLEVWRNDHRGPGCPVTDVDYLNLRLRPRDWCASGAQRSRKSTASEIATGATSVAVAASRAV